LVGEGVADEVGEVVGVGEHGGGDV
jgi:hypothetical protein